MGQFALFFLLLLDTIIADDNFNTPSKEGVFMRKSYHSIQLISLLLCVLLVLSGCTLLDSIKYKKAVEQIDLRQSEKVTLLSDEQFLKAFTQIPIVSALRTTAVADVSQETTHLSA